jgi:hypothetical protein
VLFGGRFLQQETKGKAMGEDFRGMGLTGYDAFKGEYQSTWIDSMSTGMMKGTGTYDPATKTIKETAEMSDPMSGEKSKTVRADITFVDKNHYTYAMWAKGKDGAEFKMMEIDYRRKK